MLSAIQDHVFRGRFQVTCPDDASPLLAWLGCPRALPTHGPRPVRILASRHLVKPRTLLHLGVAQHLHLSQREIDPTARSLEVRWIASPYSREVRATRAEFSFITTNVGPDS